MKTSVVTSLIGKRSVVNLAAALFWISSLSLSSPVWAANPWGRAVGEAQGLHDVTEDLRNRAHRLFPSSPATVFTCAIDDSAFQLLDMVKCGASWEQLQVALHRFQDLQSRLCQAVAQDCYMSRDRTISNYLRMIDDRYGDLVRDLSKCKPPLPTCPSPYPTHYHPPYPNPYPLPYTDLDVHPHIPQPLIPQPLIPQPLIPQPLIPQAAIPQPVIPQASPGRIDPRFMNPNFNPGGPQYWQGSMPRDSNYPRSTYDFEAATHNRSQYSGSTVGGTMPSDRMATERPVATEILNLLISRAMR